jgi:DNA polymerase-3 subunit alpha/error-prone DNA polymerase
MIPLTVRSHYSLLRGVHSISEICRTAKRLGYNRLALTDTDNLYGLWPFLSACRREDITPIIGAEITGNTPKQRAICLVENYTGYRSLCRLLTRRHLEPDFSLETAVPLHADGLVVLTQNPDHLAAWHAAGVSVAASIARTPLPPSHEICQMAKRLAVPLVATPDSFFLYPQDVKIHRLLHAIAQNTVLSRVERTDLAPMNAWLASPDAYARRFAICPEAVRNTHRIAERLLFTGPKWGLVLPPWRNADKRHASECLRAAAYAGAHRRYGSDLPEPIVDRLEKELGLISEKGFAPYFLIVRDIVRRSPRTCGRGSGAASLVAYCLGVTNVCPVKHNLYFERFLNPGRKDPPDIDVDFAWDERDDVLNAVLAQHRGHAAMVANHVLFQPRMALREVARVYGLAEREIGQVTKKLPWFWHIDSIHGDLLSRIKQRPELKDFEFSPPWPEILHLAHRIVGAPRHLSVHPGGVIITPDPIDAYVPLQWASKGIPIIQWEKDATEEAGLVKIDLLGNRSLGVIRDALADIRANGRILDESRWEPEDDPATQEAVAQGRTMGCFYIESPAMRLLQRKAGAGDFEHLVIHSSIIRPAANEFIREYIRRLHGGKWDPIHPLLTDILDETFGIMVYQEDVSRAAVSLAGFSHTEADGLRKILSKKDRVHQLADFRARFEAGATSRGVSEQQIAAIWDMMMSFSGYSFCKPHSASYARVSFQAAYLKVHHPAEFMAAVISNQGGFYSTFAYVSEARRMGLSILAPDVNQSDIRWTGRGNAVQVGLLSIKGLTAETQARIVSARLGKSYTGIRDFLNRTRPDETEARALIHCGALDAFSSNGNRAALLWELAHWQKHRVSKPAAQSLFKNAADDPPPLLPPDDPHERLRREFAVLAFLCDRHPMTLYRHVLEKRGMVKVVDLPRHIGKRVRLAAWLITGKMVHTKQGDPMEFLTFEDETGIVETTFFPQVYRRFSHAIEPGRPYILAGSVEQDWGAVTLTVEKAEALKPLSYHRALQSS